ncbi:hypothetical protein DXG01_011550 [Tephrocybe rancida]|nr:hypothetical protein DXG01_011550 [Tephrocybe rancida]
MAPKRTAVVLPQELVDSIIFAIDDIETLRLCSQVASSFRDPSQRQLFRDITIDFTSAPSTTESNVRLSRILSDNVRIAASVDSLTIFLPTPYVIVDGLTQALLELPSIRKVTLDALAHIYILIDDFPFEGASINWALVLLETIPVVNRVTTIVLKTCGPPVDPRWPIWLQFDALLTQDRFVKHLRRVVFVSHRDREPVITTVQFPLLSAKGYLFTHPSPLENERSLIW